MLKTGGRKNLSFLSYAKGYCGELRTEIHVGIEIDYTSNETGRRWLPEADKISLMPGCLIKAKKSICTKVNSRFSVLAPRSSYLSCKEETCFAKSRK